MHLAAGRLPTKEAAIGMMAFVRKRRT